MRYVILTLAALLLLSSCAPVGNTDLLSWQTFPLEIEGTLNTNDGSYDVKLLLEMSDAGTLVFTSPPRLEGITLKFAGGAAELGIDDMAIPIELSQMKNITVLLTCFNLREEQLSGVSLREENGVKHSAAVFTNAGGEVTLLLQSDLPYPLRFECQPSGISFDVSSSSTHIEISD